MKMGQFKGRLGLGSSSPAWMDSVSKCLPAVTAPALPDRPGRFTQHPLFIDGGEMAVLQQDFAVHHDQADIGSLSGIHDVGLDVVPGG